MTREEILEKSRKENAAGDEREHQIQLGAARAMLIFCLLLGFLYATTWMLVDLPLWFVNAISAVWQGALCTFHGYHAYKEKSRNRIIQAIFWGIVALLSLVQFYRRIL